MTEQYYKKSALVARQTDKGAVLVAWRGRLAFVVLWFCVRAGSLLSPLLLLLDYSLCCFYWLLLSVLWSVVYYYSSTKATKGRLDCKVYGSGEKQRYARYRPPKPTVSCVGEFSPLCSRKFVSCVSCNCSTNFSGVCGADNDLRYSNRETERGECDLNGWK